MNITYRLEIPSELTSTLNRAKALRGFKQGMVQAGGYLVGMMANYPPYMYVKLPFASEKQRRYVMAMIRAGVIKIPYQRTGVLQRSIGLSIENDGMRVSVGTNLPRAKWNLGDEQALRHRITGWRTAQTVGEREGGNAFQLIFNAARSDFE